MSDSVYTERNRLVAFLATIYPSVVTKTAIEGWEDCWHNCVYVQTPAGQMSWHFHDNDAILFVHIDRVEPDQVKWDGHSTEEKYIRLTDLTKRAFVTLEKPVINTPPDGLESIINSNPEGCTRCGEAMVHGCCNPNRVEGRSLRSALTILDHAYTRNDHELGFKLNGVVPQEASFVPRATFVNAWMTVRNYVRQVSPIDICQCGRTVNECDPIERFRDKMGQFFCLACASKEMELAVPLALPIREEIYSLDRALKEGESGYAVGGSDTHKLSLKSSVPLALTEAHINRLETAIRAEGYTVLSNPEGDVKLELKDNWKRWWNNLLLAMKFGSIAKSEAEIAKVLELCRRAKATVPDEGVPDVDLSTSNYIDDKVIEARNVVELQVHLSGKLAAWVEYSAGQLDTLINNLQEARKRIV